MSFISSRLFHLFSIIILIKKNVLLQQYKTHKKTQLHTQLRVSFAMRFYSAGIMKESELKIFFVTISLSVGKPTSTPITFRPLFAMRTET